MMTHQPKYDVGQIVYLRESAALGFLESVRVSGVHKGRDGWLYTIYASVRQPTPGQTYGDRNSLVSGSTLYYTEDELVTLCDALQLAEANARQLYERLKAQRRALCHDVTEDADGYSRYC